jgi:cytidine deaminase
VQSFKAKLGSWQQRRRTVRALKRIDPLLGQAYRAMGKAHAPYSKVHVGAAVQVRRQGILSKIPGLGQRTIRGFNSESRGDLQLCAEQTAVARLPRGDAKRAPVTKIAVLGDKSVPVPCGRCLQALVELGTPETKVVAANLKGEHRTHRLGELVPTKFKEAPAQALKPYRPLIAKAVRTYRRSIFSGINRYRPAFGTLVQTDRGESFLGMVIKDTACTYTPATEVPLNRVAQQNALKRRKDRVKTVVIVGTVSGTGQGRLPVPTADERQHLVDMNPDANVVLYNPVARAGAVVKARELLPHAYKRK